MERVEQKVCIDTDVSIAILKNNEVASVVLKKIENMNVHITTITLFELLLRKTNLEAIETFRQKADILEFNEEAARKANVIFKELQQKGRIVDIRNIYIAAACITAGCSLITLNTKNFEHIEGLQLVT